MRLEAVAALCLIVAANGAPILAHNILGKHLAWPLDGNRVFADGRRWLGASKTWRGVASAVVLSALLGPLLGVPLASSCAAGLLAMAGDSLASFCKRRLDIPSSGMALGLDQLPEAILPLLALQSELKLTLGECVVIPLAFLVLELVLSRVLYGLHLRDRPY